MIGRKNIGKNKLYGKSEKYMGKSGKMHFSLKVEELWTALYEMKCADRWARSTSHLAVSVAALVSAKSGFKGWTPHSIYGRKFQLKRPHISMKKKKYPTNKICNLSKISRRTRWQQREVLKNKTGGDKAWNKKKNRLWIPQCVLRFAIKKQVQTDRLVSILMRKKKKRELSDFRPVYSGLSVIEILHNWII